MIVSHAKRFVFVHSPKCAGTSAQAMLRQYHDDQELFLNARYSVHFGREVNYQHMRSWELEALFPRIVSAMDDYETLALARNPYDRFVSAVAQYFAQFERTLDVTTASERSLLGHVQRLIDRELRREAVIGDPRFIHFSLQSWYSMLGDRRLVKHVCPIPAGDDGWAAVFAKLGVTSFPLRRLNIRGPVLAHLLEDRGIVEWIEEFYRSDFDWLRGEAALRGLTARPVPLLRTRQPHGTHMMPLRTPAHLPDDRERDNAAADD
jgi:hypothetical protein